MNRIRSNSVIGWGHSLLLAAALVPFGASLALAQTPTPTAKVPARSISPAQPAPTAPPNVAAMPDLKIESVDLTAKIVKVKNVGTVDAVFPQGGKLLAYSPATVPAGGKITPGQIIDVELPNVSWDCPASNDELELGYFNITYNHSVPRPKDATGHTLLLVDPDNKVAESNENNNTFGISRPNPYKGSVKGTGSAQLIVSKVEVKPVPSAHGQYLDIYVKNVGTLTAYGCGARFSNTNMSSFADVFHGYVDGKDTYMEYGHSTANSLMIDHPPSVGEPYVLQPMEEKRLRSFFVQDATVDQFGVANGGLPAGCHEAKLIVNPSVDIPETRTCDNEEHVFFATGGATCGADKKNYRSSCANPNLTNLRARARAEPQLAAELKKPIVLKLTK